MRCAGVYRIVNRETGAVYWGCSSSGIGRKRRQHFKRLRTNNHSNEGLQADWLKYGPKGFKFEIWELTEPDRARERKQYHLNEHLRNHPEIPVYNVRRALRASLEYLIHPGFGPLTRLEDLPDLRAACPGTSTMRR